MGLWKHLNTELVFTNNGNMVKLNDSTYGTCKIDSKSRITLPPKVMNFLKTTPGDLISIEKDENDLDAMAELLIKKIQSVETRCRFFIYKSCTWIIDKREVNDNTITIKASEYMTKQKLKQRGAPEQCIKNWIQ